MTDHPYQFTFTLAHLHWPSRMCIQHYFQSRIFHCGKYGFLRQSDKKYLGILNIASVVPMVIYGFGLEYNPFTQEIYSNPNFETSMWYSIGFFI